jgi:hypothetical protein
VRGLRKAVCEHAPKRQYRDHAPCDLRIRRILLPVTKRTCGIPCESRRVTPICEGVRPLRASLMMCSTTSSSVVFSHVGLSRRYGRAEDADGQRDGCQTVPLRFAPGAMDVQMPLPGACMRPMAGSVGRNEMCLSRDRQYTHNSRGDGQEKKEGLEEVEVDSARQTTGTDETQNFSVAPTIQADWLASSSLLPLTTHSKRRRQLASTTSAFNFARCRPSH